MLVAPRPFKEACIRSSCAGRGKEPRRPSRPRRKKTPAPGIPGALDIVSVGLVVCPATFAVPAQAQQTCAAPDLAGDTRIWTGTLALVPNIRGGHGGLRLRCRYRRMCTAESGIYAGLKGVRRHKRYDSWGRFGNWRAHLPGGPHANWVSLRH